MEKERVPLPEEKHVKDSSHFHEGEQNLSLPVVTKEHRRTVTVLIIYGVWGGKNEETVEREGSRQGR